MGIVIAAAGPRRTVLFLANRENHREKLDFRPFVKECPNKINVSSALRNFPPHQGKKTPSRAKQGKARVGALGGRGAVWRKLT
jgi:hypothetical protein